MKKLLILLFSVMFSFSSYAEWIKVNEDTEGDSYYIDFETVKERDGYVYWWGKSFDADESFQYYF